MLATKAGEQSTTGSSQTEQKSQGDSALVMNVQEVEKIAEVKIENESSKE